MPLESSKSYVTVRDTGHMTSAEYANVAVSIVTRIYRAPLPHSGGGSRMGLITSFGHSGVPKRTHRIGERSLALLKAFAKIGIKQFPRGAERAHSSL